MGTKRRTLLAAAAVVIFFSGWLLLRLRGPVYQGHDIRALVRDEMLQVTPIDYFPQQGHLYTTQNMLRMATSTSVNDQAFFDLLNHRGAEVLPYLINALNTKDSLLWKPYVTARARMPKSIRLQLPPWPEPRYVRVKAAKIICLMGPAAKVAAPALCDRILHDPDVEVRNQSLRALCNITPAATAIPTLAAVLQRDRDPSVRAMAVNGLRHINAEPEAVVPALTAALQDSDPGVRLAAAMALGDMGPQASSALDPLRKLASSSEPDDAVVAAAHDALRTIDPLREK